VQYTHGSPTFIGSKFTCSVVKNFWRVWNELLLVGRQPFAVGRAYMARLNCREILLSLGGGGNSTMNWHGGP
jgi:hypothetical protein